MTKRKCHLITSLVFSACLISAGRAQSPPGIDLAQLKEQIHHLEVVARDQSVPASVHELNNQLLGSRRAQLSKMLQQEIEALCSYLKSVGFTSTDEKKQITDRISELEKERKAIGAVGAAPNAEPEMTADPAPAKPDEKTKKEDPNKKLRVVLGFEQVGSAAVSLSQRAFLDLTINSPTLFSFKKSGGWPLHLWGNIRFSSLPKESLSPAGGKDTEGKDALFPIKALSPTGADNFFNSLANGDLQEITRSTEFLIGPELRIHENNYVSVSVILAGGAITPISPNDSLSFFDVPGDVAKIYPQAKRLHEHAGKTVAFVAPDRDQLLKQYYGGFRFRTNFTDEDRPDAIFDVTVGQNAAVTRGKLIGPIMRIEGFYPIPMPDGKYLYLFGTAMLKMGHPRIIDPVILKPAKTLPDLPSKDVPLITTEANRDIYRFGIGVDLVKLFTKN